MKTSLQITRGEARGSDPDQLATYLGTATSRLNIIVASKDSSYRSAFVSCGPLTILDCDYNGDLDCQRIGESKRLIIFLPTSGKMLFRQEKNEILSCTGKLTIINGAYNEGLFISGARKHLALSIDRTMLQDRLSSMLERNVSTDIDFNSHIDAASDAGQFLHSFVKCAFKGMSGDTGLTSSPLALTGIVETLNGLLLEGLSHNFSEQLHQPAALAPPRHVRWAIDYMEANFDKPITIEDLAVASGVGARTLQLSFRQLLNMTPMTYLRNLRLDHVHQAFKNAPPGSSVGNIATQFGFSHLGRFALDYQRRFGTLPSETLKR